MDLRINRKKIIETIGRARYELACIEARKIASEPDYGRNSKVNLPATLSFDISDEIGNLVWGMDGGNQVKLELVSLFYEALPTFWLLVTGFEWHLHELDIKNRTWFWLWARAKLAMDDPALTQPLAYFLWCTIFENPQWVNEAWNMLVYPMPADKTLQTILMCSGAVPFVLKKRLYDELIKNPEWHYYVYTSLFYSTFDVFGDYDQKESLKILSRLSLDKNTQGLPELIAKLKA